MENIVENLAKVMTREPDEFLTNEEINENNTKIVNVIESAVDAAWKQKKWDVQQSTITFKRCCARICAELEKAGINDCWEKFAKKMEIPPSLFKQMVRS